MLKKIDKSESYFENLFSIYRNRVKKHTLFEEAILLYENVVKDITSENNVYVLVVDKDKKNLSIPTLKVNVSLSEDDEGILYECYCTKKPHIINNARRSFLYRSKVDNFLDLKINDIFVTPLLDTNKNVVAIVWIATINKIKNQFDQQDIDYIDKASKELLPAILTINNISMEKEHELVKKTPTYFNILVVDDSPIILKFVQAAIKKYNMHTITAESTLESIEKFKYKHIDLVFMDEIMPGMLGHHTIEAMRKIEIERNLEPVPIIGLTSDVSLETNNNLLSSGANLVLHKPIHQDKLIDAIKIFIPIKKI